MLEHEKVNQIVAEKQAQAAQYRGVSYDRRSDRFSAWLHRKRGSVRLGSYDTAEAAAEAVESLEKVIPRHKSFRDLYREWLDTAPRDEHKTIKAGTVLTYDEQTYVVNRVQWGRVHGRAWCYLVFRSSCKICGAGYETLTPASTAAVGIARNCPQHRKATGFKKKGSRPQRRSRAGKTGQGGIAASAKREGRAGPSAQDVLAVVALLADLALIHDRISVDDVVSAAASRAGIPGHVTRALLRDGYGAPGIADPVVQEGFVLLS